MSKLITSALLLLLSTAILGADPIVPDSYTLNTPAYNWAQDTSPTPTRLTNGLYSSLFNPPGSLGGDEMVGFNNFADITFNFSNSVTITNVTLHGVRWTGAAVEMPAEVTINNTDTFTFTQGDHDNYARYTLSFNSVSGWTGSSLNMYAIANSEWMLFEEVTFNTGEPSTQNVPDAGSTLLLCCAGLGALAVLRRRLVR